MSQPSQKTMRLRALLRRSPQTKQQGSFAWEHANAVPALVSNSGSSWRTKAGLRFLPASLSVFYPRCPPSSLSKGNKGQRVQKTLQKCKRKGSKRGGKGGSDCRKKRREGGQRLQKNEEGKGATSPEKGGREVASCNKCRKRGEKGGSECRKKGGRGAANADKPAGKGGSYCRKKRREAPTPCPAPIHLMQGAHMYWRCA